MKELKETIEKYGLKVTGTNIKYIRIQYANMIISLNAYDLFGLSEDDLMLVIKNRFYQYNIKIDLETPEYNRSITSRNVYTPVKKVSVKEKKEKIREILKSNKLLP